MADTNPAPEPIRFRAGNKRKAYRHRGDEDVDDDGTRSPSRDTQQQQQPATEDQDDDSGVAAALRMRNMRKARLRGVGFGSSAAARSEETDPREQSLVLRDLEEQEKKIEQYGITSRFAQQTGRLTDVDNKHMMEFIESRLSSRRSAQPDGSEPQDGAVAASSSSVATAIADADSAPKPVTGNSAMQGRLVEIDLAEVPDRKGKSKATTQGMPSVKGASSSGDGGRNKRPKLGKDGKPWRSRNRRNSDDIKRDQLVEQILHESRLDVYEVPKDQPPASRGTDEDGAADERLAEQFRQQFLDDVAQRRQKKKKQQPTKPSEDVLRGPKLGGSRNSRAAMRDLLLKKEKEAKK